ncbi:LPS export ABC transporter periplasmic protein LptC [Aliidiomarina sp.]|uniref:LPS export ABC transporter periplasmic protein LptC n=1 Tax=Aliidiomarina sp. TaxID=1872439 RepID=UPI003A4D8BB0
MNRRSLIILAIVAAAIGIFLWNVFHEPERADTGDASEQLIPDFTAIGLETKVFESDGRLAQQIRAERMAHFSALNLTELTNPQYVNFLPEERANANETGTIWEVSADHGRYYEGERLELEANVIILNRSNTGYINEITTDFINIDLPTRTMHTDAAVVIQGQQFTVRGNGMRVDLEAQQMELIHHVETIYRPRSRQP